MLNVKDMKKEAKNIEVIIQKITEATAEFKVLFIEKTRDWSVEEFSRINARFEKYYSLGRKGYESSNEYYKEQKFVHRNVRPTNLEKFIEKALIEAESRYKSSIEKLSLRIESKELNLDKLDIIRNPSIRVGDLQISITDGVSTVRAYTVLAWGEVNRPHYRYLVK